MYEFVYKEFLDVLVYIFIFNVSVFFTVWGTIRCLVIFDRYDNFLKKDLSRFSSIFDGITTIDYYSRYLYILYTIFEDFSASPKLDSLHTKRVVFLAIDA
jgi:hypothetical protein